jgi:YaiO family outer membrane protein
MKRAAARAVLAAALAIVAATAAADVEEAKRALGTAPPARPAYPATEIEAGFTKDNLDSGYDDWRSVYVEGAHHFGPRHTLYGAVRETERFDLRDFEALAGLYYPLAAEWTALIEGSFSPEHNVLPEYSAFGQIHRALPYGWGVALGLRHSQYTSVYTNTLVADLERYWGNWRGAYTLYVGRPQDAPAGTAHRLQLSYYYGERSAVGVSVTYGEEVENVGPPIGVTKTNVRALALFGRHWVTPQWALSYEVYTHEQGDLYTRNGVRLGLRHRF